MSLITCNGVCFCGRKIQAVKWSPRHRGIATVAVSGAICCSAYEGEYSSPYSAARQLAVTVKHLEGRETVHNPMSFRTAPIHGLGSG